MPTTPRTVAAGPELHSPKEPGEPPTPAQGTRRASSGEAPSTQREALMPGLGPFRRAFSRVSQRAMGRASEEDSGLLRRSSRFLFRSLRRTQDDRPAADQCQAPAVPGAGHGPEEPSRAIDSVRRQASPREELEELEPEAGEDAPTALSGEETGQRAGQQSWVLPGSPQPPKPLPPHSCILNFCGISRGRRRGRLGEMK